MYLHFVFTKKILYVIIKHRYEYRYICYDVDK